MKAIFGLLLAAILTFAYLINTGFYNIAATDKHWEMTEKLIEWIRINSISARTDELEIPTLSDDEFMATGALNYDAMCTECHLAPGQESTELAQGLYPQAPVFHRRAPLTNSNALNQQVKAYFWAIKNGIKMTAMPAWGPTHDDSTLWAMAFFIQKLGDMPIDRYAELTHVSEDYQHTVHEHGHVHKIQPSEKHHGHDHHDHDSKHD